MKRDSAKAIALWNLHNAEFGFADARGIRQNGLEHRIKFASKRTDDLQHLRRCRLPFQCLFQFASKSSVFRLLASAGRTGRCNSLGRTTALWLLRLSTPPFDRFAACSGAPFHRVPRRPSGIVAGRRPRSGEACSGASNKPLRGQRLQQRLRVFQIACLEPLRKPRVNPEQAVHALAAPCPESARAARSSLTASTREGRTAEVSKCHAAAHLVAVNSAIEFERQRHRVGNRYLPR